MSRPHRCGRLAGPLVLLACFAVTASAQSTALHSGTLAPGDSTLDSGEYYDEYEVEAADGEEVVAALVSFEFDPYLIVAPPSADPLENDDFGGSKDLSLIEVPVEDAVGTWRIRVTSYSSGEMGAYTLMTRTRVADGDDVGAPMEDEPETFTVRDTITVGGTVEGTLNAEDPVRFDDSYYEAYALEASAGTNVVITLESTDFDPYLVLVAPSGEIEESNDDAAKGDLNSRIETTLEEPGRWLIVANTLEPEETGAYTLSVTRR
jgi:hypothetical protein